MVLEPLSAFSVACNVLQIIEFGSKVLSNAIDYRKAANGTLPEHQDLRNILQSLKNLNAELQASMPQLGGSQALSTAETRLLEANAECLRLSNEFIDLLDRLKVKSWNARLESLRMSVKSLWYKEKVESMEDALSQARDNLNVAFLVYMNSKQATISSQNDILKSTTRVEGSILNAVTSSSGSIKDEIRLLAEQLENTNLDSVQETLSEFLTSNRGFLENLSDQLNSILTQHNDLRALADERQVADAQQRILDSLQFSQIQERRHQIHGAHKETYQWILRSAPNQSQRWDNLIAWLSSCTEPRRIYWIYGKPGSGKSTMMRFLEQNIVIPDHMLPWTENRTVLSAQYFFWNPGHKLQNSFTGLLRSLLMQLLEQAPNLVPQVVHLRKWRAARTSGNHVIDWTDSDLRHTLHEYILCARRSAKVFLLVDGLDEFEGSDDAREELISFFINMASLENVKICLSSRPWNIFRDAFSEFPQLRLEDLTHDDISKYVEAQLHSHIRFQYLLRYDRMNAESLISAITHKAAGVFLWVRLVVRELLKGLRDGDGIRVLWKKLEEIPSDLNLYFQRLMDSISPHQRQEASALLQIALHRETEFSAGHPLRLIDLSFIDEGRPDFALTGQYSFRDLDLTDREGLQFRLDSTVRRLNSRCMGLLECQYQPQCQIDEDGYDLVASRPAEEVQQDAQGAEIRRGQNFEPSIYPQIFQGPNLLRAFHLTVDFLHRSCRDFLLTPEIQSLLHQYTHGPYDPRMFLLNSRLSQFVAFETAGAGERLAVTIASYLLSALSLPSYKYTPICAVAAAAIQPILENFIQNHTFPESVWYIDPTIVSWHNEQSSFLTLAIDFELSSYIRTHLTPEYVQRKSGRPILDYILRPRFARASEWIGIGNREPNLELLGVVLHFGADPNGMYGSVTIWALFLCFLADLFAELTEDDTYVEYFGALEMLIRAGAAAILTKSWLSHETNYKYYAYVDGGMHMSPEELFSCRWPAAVPVTEWNPDLGSEPWYAVSDLLEHFRPHPGSGVDELKRLLDSRNRISV